VYGASCVLAPSWRLGVVAAGYWVTQVSSKSRLMVAAGGRISYITC